MTEPRPDGPGRGERAWILHGSLPRAIWRIALPTWGGFITHDLMGIIDMAFVGRLGPAAVAAVAMSGLLFGVVIMFGQGITTGTMAMVANAVGRGDDEAAEDAVGQSIVMGLGLSAVVALIGFTLSGPLLSLLGAAPEVAGLGVGYMRVVAGGSFAMLLGMALGSSLRGAGDAVTPLRIMVLGNVINVILDPIFIYGLMGFPRLGVAGSAWATLAARCVSLVLLLRVFFGGGHGVFRLSGRHLGPRPALMLRIARIGIFASLGMLMRNVAGILLMRLVASFGTVAVAAYGIGMRLQMMVFGPSMGFGIAAGTVVGQSLGARQPARAERAGWTAAGMAAAIGLAMTLVFWFGAGSIVRIFNDDQQVVRTGITFLRWFSASFALMSVAFVLSRAMNGAGDTLVPMLMTALTALVICLPLCYWLAHVRDDVTGVWIGLFIANCLSGFVFTAGFARGRWKAIGLALHGGAEHP